DGQIRMTLDCTNAVLDDLRCPRSDVVQAVAYCKTAEVEERFRQRQVETHIGEWPWLIIRGDICRDDLLFEAEVTACVAREKTIRQQVKTQCYLSTCSASPSQPLEPLSVGRDPSPADRLGDRHGHGHPGGHGAGGD
ncbi:MAG: hypothetical protein ACE5JX_20680, partial [Acidobacteriota bacterium]